MEKWEDKHVVKVPNTAFYQSLLNPRIAKREEINAHCDDAMHGMLRSSMTTFCQDSGR